MPSTEERLRKLVDDTLKWKDDHRGGHWTSTPA